MWFAARQNKQVGFDLRWRYGHYSMELGVSMHSSLTQNVACF